MVTVSALAWPAAHLQDSGERVSSRLVREVWHELIPLPYYGIFDNLEFRVDGRTITLLGQVTQPVLKSGD